MATSVTTRSLNRSGLTLDQLTARVGAARQVVLDTMRLIGIRHTDTYTLDDVGAIKRSIQQTANTERRCIGKYHCIKCGAFCGMLWSNGEQPDGPDCDDKACPAVADLGRTPNLER